MENRFLKQCGMVVNFAGFSNVCNFSFEELVSFFVLDMVGTLFDVLNLTCLLVGYIAWLL